MPLVPIIDLQISIDILSAAVARGAFDYNELQGVMAHMATLAELVDGEILEAEFTEINDSIVDAEWEPVGGSR